LRPITHASAAGEVWKNVFTQLLYVFCILQLYVERANIVAPIAALSRKKLRYARLGLSISSRWWRRN
jgi:hypothetical protein